VGAAGEAGGAGRSGRADLEADGSAGVSSVDEVHAVRRDLLTSIFRCEVAEVGKPFCIHVSALWSSNGVDQVGPLLQRP
jgi:hypothetical protein